MAKPTNIRRCTPGFTASITIPYFQNNHLHQKSQIISVTYRKDLNESIGKDLPKRRIRKGITTDGEDDGMIDKDD